MQEHGGVQTQRYTGQKTSNNWSVGAPDPFSISAINTRSKKKTLLLSMVLEVVERPSRHGETLNIRRTTSPLMRIVGGKKSSEVPDQPPGCEGVGTFKIGDGTELNHTVTRRMLKATVTTSPCQDEFRGPRYDFTVSIG
ncbi:hypothetical protein TNCV_1322841 [Trichonephila clavipes]|nr:hypothetical protein TNCV_1322841 [Trichonephila clavipes]